MRRTLTLRLSRKQLLSLAAIALLLIFGLQNLFSPAYGNRLGQRQLQLTNYNPSVISNYDLSFDISTAGPLGFVSIQFCSNNPTIGDPCVAPPGFNASGAALSAQTGETNFSIDSNSTANQINLTRVSANATAMPVSYSFSNITNPSSPGSYYVRLETYANSNGSGSYSDYGGIAFEIINSFGVRAEVPPYLIFCAAVSIPTLNCDSVTGNYVDFGELSDQAGSYGLSQMLTATNSASGYSITVDGTTLESGNNIVDALTNSDVSRPGTSQFGMNLRANASPGGGSNPSGPGSGTPTAGYNVPNFFRFDTDDVVASNSVPDNLRLYTVSYLVNVPAGQAPGVYASTMTYICLANF